MYLSKRPMLRAPSCINNIILSLFLPNIGMAKCVELNASSPISILFLILPHLYRWLIISIFPFLLPYLYRQLTISISPFSCQICTRSYPSASCLPPITSVPGVKHTTKSIPLDLLWLSLYHANFELGMLPNLSSLWCFCPNLIIQGLLFIHSYQEYLWQDVLERF